MLVNDYKDSLLVSVYCHEVHLYMLINMNTCY